MQYASVKKSFIKGEAICLPIFVKRTMVNRREIQVSAPLPKVLSMLL